MIFHKTSLKLASFYLAILMTISLFFSTTIYQVSVNELNRGLRNPGAIVNLPPNIRVDSDWVTQFEQNRLRAYNEAKDRILARLVLINLLILLGGGLLSYYLAMRTLQPIEEAHRSLERFTADASHELRTPITAMRSENEVALLDPALTLDGAKQQLRSNIEELENLTSLAEALLQLAHTDNTPLAKSPVDAQTIVDSAIQRVLPQSEKHTILINAKPIKNVFVLVDEVSATEALVTLLDNAIKYSPEGSEVKVRVKVDQKSAVFSVKDTGPGIAAEELPHIFDRFYRADSSRTKQGIGGYGLGLAIAKNIASTHGGSVNVSSKVGKGSTFTISFPTTAQDTEDKT